MSIVMMILHHSVEPNPITNFSKIPNLFSISMNINREKKMLLSLNPMVTRVRTKTEARDPKLSMRMGMRIPVLPKITKMIKKNKRMNKKMLRWRSQKAKSLNLSPKHNRKKSHRRSLRRSNLLNNNNRKRRNSALAESLIIISSCQFSKISMSWKKISLW